MLTANYLKNVAGQLADDQRISMIREKDETIFKSFRNLKSFKPQTPGFDKRFPLTARLNKESPKLVPYISRNLNKCISKTNTNQTRITSRPNSIPQSTRNKLGKTFMAQTAAKPYKTRPATSHMKQDNFLYGISNNQ